MNIIWFFAGIMIGSMVGGSIDVLVTDKPT